MVRFEFDSGGPGLVESWVPMVNASGVSAVEWQPDSTEKSMNTFIENYLAGLSSPKVSDRRMSGISSPGGDAPQNKLIMLRNKKPKWDDAHGGHVLNFQVCLILTICFLL